MSKIQRYRLDWETRYNHNGEYKGEGPCIRADDAGDLVKHRDYVTALADWCVKDIAICPCRKCMFERAVRFEAELVAARLLTASADKHVKRLNKEVDQRRRELAAEVWAHVQTKLELMALQKEADRLAAKLAAKSHLRSMRKRE